MDGKPRMIYCGADSGNVAAGARKLLTGEKAAANVTSTHAPLVERIISYFKGRVYHRLQRRPGKRWWDLAGEVARG